MKWGTAAPKVTVARYVSHHLFRPLASHPQIRFFTMLEEEQTMQLSSRTTVAPSPGAIPAARPPVPACPPRSVAARRASMLLYFEKSVIWEWNRYIGGEGAL